MLNILRQNILNTITYFDIFHYPVTSEEIQSFLACEIQPAKLNTCLQSLLTETIIFKLGNFYSLRNDPALATRRSNGNRMALMEMKHARTAAAILSRFPYVKGLAISGSLSKNFADDTTDIDFFIITEANRLWIARTLLQLFYKLAYIAGKRRWFCLNYYIDEKGLEISEKNIFTAMEIVTLVPMHGAQTIGKFLTANSWTDEYFPLRKTVASGIKPMRKTFLKTIIERIFNTKAGDKIDLWLMKITHMRWQKKAIQHKINEKGIYIGMMVDRHFSKPNPANFQDQIIHQYQARVAELKQKQLRSVNLVN
ncbi:MAG: hypothetical protein JWP81_1277 [Ferruginibacter sp.]|nr:hypothetical protein [Ferruginibacter sp.]